MTDREFEVVLKNAAQKLPDAPEGQLEQGRGKRRISKRSVPLMIAAALVVLLAAGAGAEQLVHHYYTHANYTLSKGAMQRRYGIQLPNTLGDFYFGTGRTLTVHEGEENGTVTYQYAGALYYYTETVASVGEDGVTETSTSTGDFLEIAVGSMGDAFWAECFDYDPETLEALWTNENEDFGWENIRTVEYKGYIIELAELWPLIEDGGYSEVARWLDQEKGLVYSLRNSAYSEEALYHNFGMDIGDGVLRHSSASPIETMECVKLMIDLNS